MKRALLAVLLFAASAAPAAETTTVTMLHFSDYHSHALPFYSEARPNQGGIARAIGYLQRAKKAGALVFNGGDMLNQGSPAWSDKYDCREWPWLDGIVDAMAFGNHDGDYGRAQLDRCRTEIHYPLLSANTTIDDEPLRSYVVLTRGSLRIGVFAVAGSDFPSLVKTKGLHFTDSVKTARDVVRLLREAEKVDAVVSIGHESIDDDFALARAVPGIDVIFGTHSHLKREFQKIAGTSTYFISPFQYLTYISRVDLVFRGHTLTGVQGRLVRVDDSLTPNATIAAEVGAMQQELEQDPRFAPLFRTIGRAAKPIAADGQLTQDSALGDLVMDVVRDAAKADVAISTSSSFRQSIDAGPITMEELRAALPYDNEIVVYELTRAQLDAVLAFSASRINTDFFSQLAGTRITVANGETTSTLPEQATYRVATTDYLARVAPGYRELFAGVAAHPTGLRIRDEVRKHLEAHSPVTATRDGRITTSPSPARSARPRPDSPRRVY
jgi:5'-nucleotidase